MVDNLPEGENKKYWEDTLDSVYATLHPTEALTEKFNRLVDAMDEAEHTRFTETLERIQKDGKVTAQEVQELINKFPALQKLLGENGWTVDQLAQYLTEMANSSKEAADGLDEVDGAAESAKADMESLVASLKKYTDQAKSVKDAQEELKESGTVSTSTLIGLLGKYEDAIDDVILRYMAGVATQEELTAALQEAYEADVANYKQALMEKNMDNEDFYSGWLSQNTDIIKNLKTQYGIDASQYKTFAELKTIIEKAEQGNQTQIVKDGQVDREALFTQLQNAFAATQDTMVLNAEMNRLKDAWDEQKKREEEALALQKKQLAVEEAQKAVQDAMLALQTARNERNVYTLKDGVWAWRADEEAIAKAEKALADAEKAKEEAEKDLQDYKEEQAHKLILKRLEEQIKTLEAQKKGLEEQKKLIDRQKELLNKQIDAINKQITAFEKESKARQEFIQGLIDQNEKEKKAWEDHYAALKEQYSQQLEALEAEKKAAEERQKAAQKQYDQWMDTWKDIQKSIETPARDISEILNDIAKYGTPAMAGQVDRVTDLLRQLGYVLDDVVSGGGYDPDDGWGGDSDGSSGMSRQEIIDRMLANHNRMYNTQDQNEKDALIDENQRLGAMIGANFDRASGKWDIFDYSGPVVTVRPWAYEGAGGYDLSDYGPAIPMPTMEQLANDGYDEFIARNGILTGEDFRAAAQAYAVSPRPMSTTYNDDHRVIMNGVTIGSSMMQRPLSETLQLIALNMGT